MTINECRQYCREVANEFINKDAKKFLSEYGFEMDTDEPLEGSNMLLMTRKSR